MSTTKKYDLYKFWIKSNRGTDCCIIKSFPKNTSKEIIVDKLKSWCEKFSAWEQSEVTYGFIKIICRKNLKTLRKERDLLEKRMLKLTKTQNILYKKVSILSGIIYQKECIYKNRKTTEGQNL